MHKLLIADSNEAFRQQLAEAFCPYYHTFVCGTGLEALDILFREHCDCELENDAETAEEFRQQARAFFEKLIGGKKKLADLIATVEAQFEAYKANPDAFPGTVTDVSTMIRLAVTGQTSSPDLYTVMQILGQERTAQRIRDAIFSLN